MKLENRSNFYLINKPKTWTSQDLCSKFKYLYKFKKVGHAGTLDPNAEGLMLLATDKYTKLFNYTKETDKTYKVSTLFGYSSDSIDTDTDVYREDNTLLARFRKNVISKEEFEKRLLILRLVHENLQYAIFCIEKRITGPQTG